MTSCSLDRRRGDDPAEGDKTEDEELHRASFLTASLVACASCSAPRVVCSGVAGGAAPGIIEFGSSTKPPFPNGIGVNPGMTGGGTVLHAAGPNAN
ncbi:MAG: hypothetical protein WB562_10030 [Candidatus Sulfotelmatobacter sp.]